MIKRTIQKRMEERLFKGKIIILYGARRVGKTTIAKSITAKHKNSRYINCELLQNKTALETTNSNLLKTFLGNYRLIVLDEAQHIENIGLILKILVDTFPDMQIIATGSSGFELGQKVSEPLTGRARRFMLYPFSFKELQNHTDNITLHAQLENMLRFGLYPEVFNQPESEAIEQLYEITNNYLFKDVLQFERLKRSDLLTNLLQAIALQLGSEISYNELANMLGVSVHTIKRYIDLLEKTFVIFRLPSYSRNPRKEISKSQKIYFWDIGIRNALIQNFNKFSLRNDTGALWENFCIAERIKANQNKGNYAKTFFWRTYQKNEIDYIEEKDDKISAFEFKYNPRKKTPKPAMFLKLYPDADYKVINNENFMYEFLGIPEFGNDLDN